MGDWIPEQQQADKVKIDGMWTPGTCEFQGLSSVREFQVLDHIFGNSGGTVRFTGRKLSRFKILLHLYDPDDWRDYYALKPTLDKLPVGDTKAHAVSHPLLAGAGVGAVVFEEISAPELTQETGEWTITLSCIEYREPRVETAKVKGAKATQADAVDEAIDKKAGELDELNASYAGAPT